jgi:hypothetical protein
LNYSVREEVGNDDIVDNHVDNRLEELVDQYLNRGLQEVWQPSNDEDCEVPTKLDWRIFKKKFSVEEINNWCTCVAVCLQRKTIIKKTVFKVDVYSKSVFNRPEYNIEWLKVDVKVQKLSPVYHYTTFLLINSESSSGRFNSEGRNLDVLDLEKS